MRNNRRPNRRLTNSPSRKSKRGAGGNTAVFATSTGVTLVDTKNPGWGQVLLDKVKSITDKPVTTVINTHAHYDHVSGNIAMGPTVEIIAHEFTAKLMPTISSVTGRGAPTTCSRPLLARGCRHAHSRTS